MLAEQAHAILVDASTIGEGLAWELEILRQRHPGRLVVISDSAEHAGVSVAGGIIVPLNGRRRQFRKNVKKALSMAISVADPNTREVCRAIVSTSKGSFTIEVHRTWAPLSANHFYELVRAHYYSQARFYRVVKGLVVQFGMSADPAVYRQWQRRRLKSEQARTSNKRGTVCFARSAADGSRTTRLFINLADNGFLDESNVPFGVVSSGMEVVDSLYSGYEEHQSNGNGVDQNRLWREGNRYLQSEFPRLDYILDVQLQE
jgi:cyclophilin family peptidyl-prolyl cis-trans isomerase